MTRQEMLSLFSAILTEDTHIAGPSILSPTLEEYDIGEMHTLLYSAATGEAMLMKNSEVVLRSGKDARAFRDEMILLFNA